MKTVYVIVHDTNYNRGTAKIAFERKEDAEVMLGIFKDTSSGELKIVEVPLQPPSAKPPAMRGGEAPPVGVFVPRYGGNIEELCCSEDEPRVGNIGGADLP